MADKKRYRGVVIGCGKIGALFEAEPRRAKPASHAGALVSNKKTDLVALVDTGKKNLAHAKRLFPGVALYTSSESCFKSEQPDIVIIATPANVRVPLVRLCVKYGVKMIICEKPLARSAAEARQIRNILKGTKTVFVLNYQRRFSPLFTRARNEISKGSIGRVQQVTCYYSNGLYNNGGHIIDALNFLLGDTITSAIGLLNANNRTCPQGDINVDGILRTKCGAVITIQSFDQNAYGIHDIKILGEKGAITLTSFGQRGIWEFARESQFAGIKQLTSSSSKELVVPLSATKGALEHAMRCREKGSMPESGPESGTAVLNALDALRKSAARGGMHVRV